MYPRVGSLLFARRPPFGGSLWLAALLLGASPRFATAENNPSEAKDKISSEAVKATVSRVMASLERYSVRLSLIDKRGLPLKVGEPHTLRLKASVSGVPAGFDVYALVLMADDERILVERISRDVKAPQSKSRSLALSLKNFGYRQMGTVSSKGKPVLDIGYADIRGFGVTFGGKLGGGSHSFLKIGRDNYPTHVSLPAETLGKLLTGGEPEEKDDAPLKEQDERFPVTVNLAYLGTTDSGRAEIIDDIALTLTPPKKVPFFFNGVLLAPVVVKRHPNGLAVLRYDDERVNRLIVRSESPPGAKRLSPPQPKPKKERPETKLRASLLEPVQARVGRKLKVPLRVDYEKLKPNSELYVVLQPAHGEKVLREQGGRVRKGSFSGLSVTSCQDPAATAGQLRIKPRPIVLSQPVVGKVEGGWIASVEKGGTGTARGSVTFVAPPYNAFYDRIRVTPVVLAWKDDGRLCSYLTTDNSGFVDIKIKNR